MQSSIDLCEAAGLNVEQMPLMDIFLASGQILNDELLRKKALAFLQGSVLHEDAYPAALNAMTPAERMALRERVSGVVPFPVKK